MDAARTHVGFKFGMLHLDLPHAGAGVHIVGKDLAVDLSMVVVIQNGVRIHSSQTGIGQRCGLGCGVEVILHMALRAGKGCRVHILKLLTQSIRKIGVGNHQLVAGVGVAVVAADGLVDLSQHVLKGQPVGGIAHFVDHGGEVRGLAAEAVRQRVRPPGGGHVLHGVGVATGAAVELGEGHSLVNHADHGVILRVVVHLGVFTVGKVGRVDFRVGFRPVLRGHDSNAGAGLDDLCLSLFSALDSRGRRRVTGLAQRRNLRGLAGIQIRLRRLKSLVHAVHNRLGGDGRAGYGIHIVTKGEAAGLTDKLTPEVGLLHHIAKALRLGVLSGVDVHACHLAAVTDAHLHLHGAVSALAGNVDNHTRVRGVQLVDALRGSLLLFGGGAGENAAELQILRPVVLSRGIDEIPDKVARLVDAAAHRAGGNGGAGDGIHIIPHLRRNGQARELVGKRRLLGFRAQAGGFREFRAAHTDAGDGALQIHAYMDFHRAAKAGDGHLCHIADLAAVLHRRVAAVYGASLRKRNFLKGIRPGEAGIAGSIG